MFIVVGIGLVFSVIFHAGVREKSGQHDSPDSEKTLSESSALITIEKSTLNRLKMSWKCWLKEHQFYQVKYELFDYPFHKILPCATLFANDGTITLADDIIRQKNRTYLQRRPP